MKNIFKILIILFLIVVISAPFVYNTEDKFIDAEIRAKTQGSFVNLSQGYTHYQQENSGANKTVVLVHGFSVPYYIWDDTFSFLVKHGFHVIRYDLYGRGYSDRPDVKYTQELFDRQLVELLNALKISKPINIIGLSMGGAITAKFVSDHPEKINKVIFIDPSHEAHKSSIFSIPLVAQYYATVFWLPKAAKSQLGDFANPQRFTTWPDKYRTQMQYKGFRNALVSTLKYFFSNDKLYLYEKVGSLNKPTLLFWGEEDNTLPISRSPRVAKALKTTTIRLKDTGHIGNVEHPDIVNPRILSFFNAQD